MSQADWFRAAEVGDLATLETLLGADPQLLDSQDDGQWTALCHACFQGHATVVQWLVEHGANLHLNSPIHYAGQKKHRKICRLLVEHGVIDDSVSARAAPTFRAVYTGDQMALAELVSTNPRQANIKDKEGATLLHVAAIHGDSECTKTLIAAGGNVNAQYKDDKVTPVQEAAAHQHYDVCALLLAAGAKLDLFAACLMGDAKLVDEVLAATSPNIHRKRRGISLLETVCEAGHVDVGRRLVTAGAELDVFSAASLGLLEEVKALVADKPRLVSAKRKLFAYEPLHCAAECGQPEVARFLIEQGADVNAKNEWGMRPLLFAIIAARNYAPHQGHFGVCKVLLENGADLSACDDYGSSPLSLAEGTIDYGLEHGYDMEVPEKILALIRAGC